MLTARIVLATTLAGRLDAQALSPSLPGAGLTPCTVTRVVDGDTVHCSPLGSVRLIGIDAPEGRQAPFASQATAALAALLPLGTALQVERDAQPRDRYGRVLAYLWRNGELVNWRMVRDGWAVTLPYAGTSRHAASLEAAESLARAERRGLWQVQGFDCRPRDFRARRC